MRSFLSLVRSRTAALLGVCALALTQAACAHPVVVEPSVVVQARLGGPVYGSIYAPVYGPPPVVVSPHPHIWMAPVMPSRAWGYPEPRHHHKHHKHQWRGQGLDHGWGRREGFRH